MNKLVILVVVLSILGKHSLVQACVYVFDNDWEYCVGYPQFNVNITFKVWDSYNSPSKDYFRVTLYGNSTDEEEVSKVINPYIS